MVTPLNTPREIRVTTAGGAGPASTAGPARRGCSAPASASARADSCPSARTDGCPVSVRIGGRQRRVVRISNEWRIDDEWWQQEISRHYFEMELADGQVITVFHDLVSGSWSRQRY